MATKVEQFDTAEERNARADELWAQGYRHINKTSDPVAIAWKQVYIVSYPPKPEEKPKPQVEKENTNGV